MERTYESAGAAGTAAGALDSRSSAGAACLPLVRVRYELAAGGRQELHRRFSSHTFGVQTAGAMRAAWVRRGREEATRQETSWLVYFPPSDDDDTFVWNADRDVDVRSVMMSRDYVAAVAAAEGLGPPADPVPRFGFHDRGLEPRLRRLAGRAGEADPLQAEADALAIALWILGRESGDRGRAWRADGSRFSLHEGRRLVDYVDAALGTTISLPGMADVVGLSPGHFRRKFHRSYGASPSHFVALCRVQQAIELLRRSDESLARIAEIVGYSSQSHFTNAFRAVVGTSPGRFRRDVGRAG